MESSTLEKLLRIQSSAPEASSNQANAGAPTAPAPPPEQRSSHIGRGASPYSKQFRVAFDFLQQYTENPPRTADDWSSIVDDMTRRARDNDDDEFLLALLCAAHEQLERVYKSGEAARASQELQERREDGGS